MEALRSEVQTSFRPDILTRPRVCFARDGSADLTRSEERYYQALLLMKRVQFDTPLPWTTKPLYEWFSQTVRGVYVGSDTSSCCRPPGVIQITSSEPLEDQLGNLTHPFEVLVHEARHVENYPHKCGFKDLTIEELGAFGVQYYLMLWLGVHSRGGPLSAYDREYALFRAAELRWSAFCYECAAP